MVNLLESAIFWKVYQKLLSNPIDMETEGTIESVCIMQLEIRKNVRAFFLRDKANCR